MGRNDFVCIDSKGRLCRYGLHFQRAEDDGAYPIIVYQCDIRHGLNIRDVGATTQTRDDEEGRLCDHPDVFIVPEGKTMVFEATGTARCWAGEHRGASATWFIAGKVKNERGTIVHVAPARNRKGSEWTESDFTPESRDLSIAKSTLRPAPSDAGVVEFVFHGVKGEPRNEFDVRVDVTLSEVDA